MALKGLGGGVECGNQGGWFDALGALERREVKRGRKPKRNVWVEMDHA